MGGEGFCIGLGLQYALWIRYYFPSNEAEGSSIHILRMICIASSNLNNLSWLDGKELIPYAKDSSSFQAAPIPINSLPLLSTSKVAATFAKTDGYLYITPVTSVPSFIFEVTPASADIAVQPSSMGSSIFPTMGI